MALYADNASSSDETGKASAIKYFLDTIKFTNKYDSVVMARSWSLFLRNHILHNSSGQEDQLLYDVLDLVSSERVKTEGLSL